MNYEPSQIEKLARGIMLGLIPSTLLVFFFLGLFAMSARYSSNETKEIVGQWFFSSPDILGLA